MIGQHKKESKKKLKPNCKKPDKTRTLRSGLCSGVNCKKTAKKKRKKKWFLQVYLFW